MNTASHECEVQLERAILGGEFAVGDRLPAERRLAESHGVNRVTIRSALGALTARGLVKPRQGSGYVVCALRDSSGGPSLLPKLTKLGRLPIAQVAEDLLRLRRHLARALMEHFAQMDEVETGLIEAAIEDYERLAERQQPPRAFAEADRAVLQALVAAAKSVTFDLCLLPVTDVLMELPALHPVLYDAPKTNAAAYRVVLAWLWSDRSAAFPIDDVLQTRDARSLALLETRT